MSLKLCRVKEKLVNYYMEHDDKVLFNKKEKRPYIGILTELSTYKYIIPLSSPKENDYDASTGELKNNTFTIFRLEDFDTVKEKEEYLLSIINLSPEEKIEDHKKKINLGKVFLSNMIPVKDIDIEYIDISLEEKQYASLLIKQYIQIKKIEKKIINNSKIIYRKKISDPFLETGFLKACCNFGNLEVLRSKFEEN